MKSSYHILPLFAAFVVPGSLALEIAGVNLPAAFSLSTAFTVSMVSLLGSIAFADYARGRQARHAVRALAAEAKAAHPLAA